MNAFLTISPEKQILSIESLSASIDDITVIALASCPHCKAIFNCKLDIAEHCIGHVSLKYLLARFGTFCCNANALR